MLACDGARGLALASIPLAAAFGALTIVQLVFVALIVGGFSVFFDIAYQSWLPSIVAHDDLVRANGRLAATDATGRLAGPGIAGALVGLIGGARTLWVDALSFAVAAASTALVRSTEPPPDTSTPHEPLRRELTTGLRWLVRARPLRYLVAANSWMNFFVAVWIPVETLFLIRTLHASTWTAGLVIALGSSGGIIGGLSSNRVTIALGNARTLVLCGAIAGPFALFAPLATGLLGPWAVSLGLFGVTATSAISSSCNVAYRQQTTPPALLARVGSAARLISFSMVPVGTLTGGLLLGIATPRAVLTIAATGYGAAVLVLRPIWTHRTLTEPNPPAPRHTPAIPTDLPE